MRGKTPTPSEIPTRRIRGARRREVIEGYGFRGEAEAGFEEGAWKWGVL